MVMSLRVWATGLAVLATTGCSLFEPNRDFGDLPTLTVESSVVQVPGTVTARVVNASSKTWWMSVCAYSTTVEVLTDEGWHHAPVTTFPKTCAAAGISISPDGGTKDIAVPLSGETEPGTYRIQMMIFTLDNAEFPVLSNPFEVE